MNEPVISKTYECVALDDAGDCTQWQEIQPDSNGLLPPLTQSEQSQITMSLIGVMVTVWLFKQLKRAIF